MKHMSDGFVVAVFCFIVFVFFFVLMLGLRSTEVTKGEPSKQVCDTLYGGGWYCYCR